MLWWFTAIEEVWPLEPGFRAAFDWSEVNWALRGPWICRFIGVWKGCCLLVITIKPLNGKKMRLWLKNSTYPIIKNVHFHIYVLRGWIKVIKPLKCAFHKVFIMQFIVLIFLHLVLFHVGFMSNLSGVARASAGSASVCTWPSEHREGGAGSLQQPGASLSASRSGALCPGTVLPG